MERSAAALVQRSSEFPSLVANPPSPSVIHQHLPASGFPLMPGWDIVRSFGPVPANDR
jgi:hypothetical protein